MICLIGILGCRANTIELVGAACIRLRLRFCGVREGALEVAFAATATLGGRNARAWRLISTCVATRELHAGVPWSKHALMFVFTGDRLLF